MGTQQSDDDDPFSDSRAGFPGRPSWSATGSHPDEEGTVRSSLALRVRIPLAVGVVIVMALGAAAYAGYRIGISTTSDSSPDAPAGSQTTSRTSPSAMPTSPGRSAVDATLAGLLVKGRAGRADYDRDRFGQEWADVDRNGCDTRNDVLRRDLDAVEVRPGTRGCLVERGVLDDPYSGKPINFERGNDTSVLVQIDHVVSLSNAWQTGAFAWTDERREQFANDPLNLLAVDGSLNIQKSDGDAATWLPPARDSWCDLVSRQVAVKAKYELWVTVAEREAVVRVLGRCPGQQLPATDGR